MSNTLLDSPLYKVLKDICPVSAPANTAYDIATASPEDKVKLALAILESIPNPLSRVSEACYDLSMYLEHDV